MFQQTSWLNQRRETNDKTAREAIRVYVRRVVKICGTGNRHNQDEPQCVTEQAEDNVKIRTLRNHHDSDQA